MLKCSCLRFAVPLKRGWPAYNNLHTIQWEQTKSMDLIYESRHINQNTFYSLFRIRMKKKNKFDFSRSFFVDRMWMKSVRYKFLTAELYKQTKGIISFFKFQQYEKASSHFEHRLYCIFRWHGKFLFLGNSNLARHVIVDNTLQTYTKIIFTFFKSSHDRFRPCLRDSSDGLFIFIITRRI